VPLSFKNCKYYAQVVNAAGKFFSVRVATFGINTGLITFSFMLSWHLILRRDHSPNAFKTPNFIAVAFCKAAAPSAVGLALTMMHFEIACKT